MPATFQAPSPFYADLRERVDDHFRTRRSPRRGGLVAWLQVGVILLGGVVCHAAILSDLFAGLALFGWQLAAGLFTYLIAIQVAHDASHGSLTGSKRSDQLLVRLFDLAGVSSFVWTYDHLKSHHAWPNVLDRDNALDGDGVMRVHPRAPWRPAHRFQHLYAWPLYACASLHRWFVHDWVRLVRGQSGEESLGEMSLGEKAWFVTGVAARNLLFLGLPIAWLSVPAWQVLAGFVAMHLVIGCMLIVAVQLTHQTEGATFFEVGDGAAIALPYDLAIVACTSDFSVDSWVVTFLTGGLNLHTIHHLFPRVHHRHLMALNRILVQTAADHGVELRQRRCVSTQIIAHYRYLRACGRRPGRAPSTLPVLSFP
ncbi:MAG: fatty acid desaturase [Myxococcales bacterium]|nr:fatty acid desaturase [Myxococcales bacterium]